jgi:hypothetical protein
MNRYERIDSFETRMAQFAKGTRDRAERVPPGDERNWLLKRAYN